MTGSLLVFENPDKKINAVDYYKNEEYNLEIGDDIIYESDDMSDEEIIEWAEDHGYLEEEEGYVDEDGDPNIESLRELKRTNEEEYSLGRNTDAAEKAALLKSQSFQSKIVSKKDAQERNKKCK